MPSRRIRRWKRRLKRRLRSVRYSSKANLIFLGVGGLILIGALWIVITGLIARSDLQDIQSRLAQVRVLVAQGKVSEARKLANDIPSMADRASGMTSGPAWWVGSKIPYLGEPLHVIRTTTTVTAYLGSHAIPQLVDVASAINPEQLRGAGNTIKIAPLAKAAPELEEASSALTYATRQVSALPDSWLGSVNHLRGNLRTQFRLVGGYVSAAARAAKVLPAMLGADGRTLRYFIGLQNESELRGTGGLPGAFAIARVHDGAITFERFESDTALLPAAQMQMIKTGLDFGKSYNGLYGAALPTTQYVDSNVSPHFPFAAQIWATMWEKQFKQHIDGVVAVDPTALSYFLQATGPAIVPHTPNFVISAANVVQVTEKDAYTLLPNPVQRKAFLVNVLRAAAKKLTSGAGDPYLLVQAASRSTSEQRLLAWTRDPTVEQLLQQTTYAGAINDTGRPLSALIVNNASAGKLDYYLTRTIDYVRTGCGPTRDVSVTFTLTNKAPGRGLPGYVADRLDAHPPPTAKRGDSHVIVDYYATGGAALRSVTINGKSATTDVSDTLGRTVFRFDLELPRTVTQTVQLTLQEPAAHGEPQIWRQPGVMPIVVTSRSQQC